MIGSVLAACLAYSPHQAAAISQPSASPPNVVVLVIDDTRWDSIGAAGNRIVRTPRLDALAADGVRFTQARVTTSICMVSRATLLTGQYMSRHGIDRFGKPLTPEAFARTYPGCCAAPGTGPATSASTTSARPRPADFDFVRAYHGRHWLDGRRRRTRPRHRAERARFGRVPAGAAEGQALPAERRLLRAARGRQRAGTVPAAGVERGRSIEGVKVPPSPLGGAKFLAALPPFLAADANEGRVRFNGGSTRRSATRTT